MSTLRRARSYFADFDPRLRDGDHDVVVRAISAAIGLGIGRNGRNPGRPGLPPGTSIRLKPAMSRPMQCTECSVRLRAIALDQDPLFGPCMYLLP